jgi:hypothetical protein
MQVMRTEEGTERTEGALKEAFDVKCRNKSGRESEGGRAEEGLEEANRACQLAPGRGGARRAQAEASRFTRPRSPRSSKITFAHDFLPGPRIRHAQPIMDGARFFLTVNNMQSWSFCCAC